MMDYSKTLGDIGTLIMIISVLKLLNNSLKDF
jgi:hypothetical protein